jgi:hypothetical protein
MGYEILKHDKLILNKCNESNTLEINISNFLGFQMYEGEH